MSIAPRTKISLGDLKQICEVQRLVSTKDDEGFHLEEWTTIAKPRCKVEFDDRLMREFLKDAGTDTTDVKILTFRYFDGLSVKDRIIFKDKAYQVYGFHNLEEQNRFYKVWARGIV